MKDHQKPSVETPTISRSFARRVLVQVLGPTARFQRMKGLGDGAIGWRVLVEDKELVRVTPKPEALGQYDPEDRAMPHWLLRAACHAVGLGLEVQGPHKVKTFRLPPAPAGASDPA